MRTRIAFFHAALGAVTLFGLDMWRLSEGQVNVVQPFQTALIGLGYFAMIGIAVALGRYTKASEDLAAQRGIDVANLEQVNRLIIQDMQDGVLVVDLNGVVRGHNAQVTRLLGGFGRMRGGMRLAEFSSTLHDYWRRWQEDDAETLPPFKVDVTQRLLRVRLVRIGSGLNGGTLIYLEDLGRAQSEAQQMKLAAMGRLTASMIKSTAHRHRPRTLRGRQPTTRPASRPAAWCRSRHGCPWPTLRPPCSAICPCRTREHPRGDPW